MLVFDSATDCIKISLFLLFSLMVHLQICRGEVFYFFFKNIREVDLRIDILVECMFLPNTLKGD